MMHPGYCKVCGSPTHNIQRQYPVGHPLSGRPMRGGIGSPLPGIVKVNIILTNGTWMTLTVHRNCADLITPETLPQLWQQCLTTFKFEEDNRGLLGAKPLTSQQKDQVDRYLVNLASTIPLGVCCIEEMTP